MIDFVLPVEYPIGQPYAKEKEVSENNNLDFMRDPRLYVQAYIKANRLEILPSGGIRDKTGRGPQDLFNTMYLDYIKNVQTHNSIEKNTKLPKDRVTCKVFGEKIMTMAFYECISLSQAETRNKLIASLDCEHEDLSPVKKFVEAVVGKDSELDVAVMAHWLWSVKNKMKGRLITYHIMPIFFGPQGGGKSVAIKHLIGPVEDYKLNINMEQITDERNYQAMSTNYVVFFDEMERANKVDVDALKKQVSVDYNDYRPLYTNTSQKAIQACSFIGATNRQVKEQIVDASGMRRFWQIVCLPKLDWKAISSINYLDMWKGIDENKEDGYILPHLDKIRAEQQELVYTDDLDTYIAFKNLAVGVNGSKTITFSELYTDYKIWSQDFGQKLLPSNWFAIKLKGKGIERNPLKKDLWLVNADFVPSFNNMQPDNKPLKAVK